MKEALRDSGLQISEAPGMGPFVLRYGTAPLNAAAGRTMVTVGLAGQAGPLVEESGIYSVPEVLPPMGSAPSAMPVVVREADSVPPMQYPSGAPVRIDPGQ